MTFTKARLKDALLRKDIFTKTKSAQIIDTLFELMKQSLQNGDDERISGFGKFSVKECNGNFPGSPFTKEETMFIRLWNLQGILKPLPR